MNGQRSTVGWGWAWLALVLALALHVFDEATHDFLAVYNPVVRSLRERIPWLPLPAFTFEVWLGGLIAAVIALLLLTAFAFRGAPWLRHLAPAFALLMLGNGLLHIGASIYWGRLAPGVLSSPLLIAASAWLAAMLRSGSVSRLPRQPWR